MASLACGIAGLAFLAEAVEPSRGQERFCSEVESSKNPRRSGAAGKQPSVVLAVYENEYCAVETVPDFARQMSDRYGCHCTVLQGKDGVGIPGLEALAAADVLVLYVWRHALPKEQMAAIRRYLEAGRPLVGLRTSSHAFDIMAEPPAGLETWPAFDRDVLGGNYQDHYRSDRSMRISAANGMAGHPILAGLQLCSWTSSASLYKNSPLPSNTTALLIGASEGNSEPIAWTHRYHGGRVFYTSLGNVQDFQTPQFRRMLINAIFWAMDRPVPEKS